MHKQHAVNTYVGVELQLHRYRPRNQMEMIGQPHAPDTLFPGEKVVRDFSVRCWVGPRAGLYVTVERKFFSSAGNQNPTPHSSIP
jgi:hypothetical protein